jgi:UDP-N-acetylglucosamine 2-epimerase (non-hydrolysing)
MEGERDLETGAFLHVVGARPNFVKAAPVLAGLEELGASQHLLHTGQHYDESMSGSFLRDFGLREPEINLGVGSGSHGTQTAAILSGIEQPLLALRPRAVIVYGDVNSALAAALASVKLGIPVAHVEAGLRSFDRSMPEEINRVLVDAVADAHFVTSPEAIGHLHDEGIAAEKIFYVGNPMIDSLSRVRPLLASINITDRLELPDVFGVVTLHRPSNVDDREGAARIVTALGKVGAEVPLILPLHPRGESVLREAGLFQTPGVTVLPPLGYMDFIALIASSAIVLTDSGGVQEETTVLGIPCITLRSNTERPITISHGTNRLIGERLDRLAEDVQSAIRKGPQQIEPPPLWDGRSGERIARHLLALFPTGRR